jgi:hypothetical protein
MGINNPSFKSKRDGQTFKKIFQTNASSFLKRKRHKERSFGRCPGRESSGNVHILGMKVPV